MSMFSQHFLIRRKSDDKYWAGGRPEDEDSWRQGGGIRIFAKPDAQLICRHLLAGIECIIDEDE